MNVFSPISEYVSFSDVWYFVSSKSMRARILEAAAGGAEVTMAGGRAMVILWVVLSWTWSGVSTTRGEGGGG